MLGLPGGTPWWLLQSTFRESGKNKLGLEGAQCTLDGCQFMAAVHFFFPLMCEFEKTTLMFFPVESGARDQSGYISLLPWPQFASPVCQPLLPMRQSKPSLWPFLPGVRRDSALFCVLYRIAVVLRFLTGASLSLVYPPSLKVRRCGVLTLCYS